MYKERSLSAMDSATLVHLQKPAELPRGWLRGQPQRTSAQMEVSQNADKSKQGEGILAYMDERVWNSWEFHQSYKFGAVGGKGELIL